MILFAVTLQIREGNGTPLQYSCLENPMDRGAWQAAVPGVARSQTRLRDFTFTFPFMHWRRKWQPTPVFLPGESQGRGSLMGCCLWGCTESDTTEATQQQQQQLRNLTTQDERCTDSDFDNALTIGSLRSPYIQHVSYMYTFGVSNQLFGPLLLIMSRQLRLTKHLKTTGFPVVMYGCESWTIKRLSVEELMLLNCGVGEDS